MFARLDRYLGFIPLNIQVMWTYRVRVLIFMINDLVLLLIQYFLWSAVFGGNGGTLGTISLGQYLSYVALGMIFGRLTACGIDGNVGGTIKDGAIAMHLVRPYSFFGEQVAQQVGFTVGNLLALVPFVVIVAFLVPIASVSLTTVALTVLSLALTYVLALLVAFLLGLVAFWITNYWGLFLFKDQAIALFSGQVIAFNLLFQLANAPSGNFPVPFLPEELTKGLLTGLGYVAYATPFPSLYYVPSAIATGMLSTPTEIAWHLGMQAFWVLAMALVVWLTWGRALKRVTIQGG
ncbi:MAG: ABC-2 family transporter protein [Spirochaetales bacterium]